MAHGPTNAAKHGHRNLSWAASTSTAQPLLHTAFHLADLQHAGKMARQACMRQPGRAAPQPPGTARSQHAQERSKEPWPSRMANRTRARATALLE